ILLYQALGQPAPTFAPVPMILAAAGKRLSKRPGATPAAESRNQGTLPDARVNSSALLAWNPGPEEERFRREQRMARFALEGINSRSAVFGPAKLEGMNGQYIQRMSATELEPLVIEAFERAGAPDPGSAAADRDRLHAVIDLLKTRARTIDDFARYGTPYLSEDFEYDAAAVAKHWKDGDTAPRL